MPKSNDNVVAEQGTEHSPNTKTLEESVNGNEPEEPHTTGEGDTHTSDVGAVPGTVQIVMVINFWMFTLLVDHHLH